MSDHMYKVTVKIFVSLGQNNDEAITAWLVQTEILPCKATIAWISEFDVPDGGAGDTEVTFQSYDKRTLLDIAELADAYDMLVG